MNLKVTLQNYLKVTLQNYLKVALQNSYIKILISIILAVVALFLMVMFINSNDLPMAVVFSLVAVLFLSIGFFSLLDIFVH